jgi:hypothetical protein
VDASLRQVVLRYGQLLDQEGIAAIRKRIARLREAMAVLQGMPLENGDEPAWQFVPPDASIARSTPEATGRG